MLSAFQSLFIAIGLESMDARRGDARANKGWAFRLITMMTLTSGTALIMWLGEQISEKGIGNGISLIIFAGIVVRLPSALEGTYQLLRTGELKPLALLGVLALMLAVTAAVIVMQEGQRKIQVQYAKRVVGRRVRGAVDPHPLRINGRRHLATSRRRHPVRRHGAVRPHVVDAGHVRRAVPAPAPRALLRSLGFIVFHVLLHRDHLQPERLADNMAYAGSFRGYDRARRRRSTSTGS